MNVKKILAICIVALMTLEAGGCGAGSAALGSAANNKDESAVSSEATVITDESVSAQDTSVAADESILAQSPESAAADESIPSEEETAGGDESAARILKRFRDLIVIIAGMSLVCWLLVSVAGIIPREVPHGTGHLRDPTIVYIYPLQGTERSRAGGAQHGSAAGKGRIRRGQDAVPVCQ